MLIDTSTTYPTTALDVAETDIVVPAQGPASARLARSEASALALRMDFADPRFAVLNASGDLDEVTAPQLAELLWPRLVTALPALAVDISKLTFLGVAGLELLANANGYAQHRGVALVIVNNTRAVDRALAAGGLDVTLSCFATVADARASAVPADRAA